MTRRRVLTDAQVREIIELYHTTQLGYQRIADAYGVGASTIRDVVKFWTQYSARCA